MARGPEGRRGTTRGLREPAEELARLQRERLFAHRILPSRPLRSIREAAAFVREREIVMATGRSALPSLADAIVGRPIVGSWMADPEVHRIHDVAFELDETHEFPAARLVGGRRALLSPRLGPAVARIAAHAGRVAAARSTLSPLAQRLLAETERRGQVALHEWNAGSREARAARLDLVRELLVASETVHTADGRHGAVVRPWSDGEIARRFGAEGARMSYADAQRTLLVAAIRSAVVAPQKEVRKWFVFGAQAGDELERSGQIRSLHVGREIWLADAEI